MMKHNIVNGKPYSNCNWFAESRTQFTVNETSTLWQKVGLWAVQGYQVVPSVQSIKMRKEKMLVQKNQLCILLFTKCNCSIRNSGNLSRPRLAAQTSPLHSYCEPANYQISTGAEVYSTLSFGFILIPSRFRVFFFLPLNGDKQF